MRPAREGDATIRSWLDSHPSWTRTEVDGGRGAIAREYKFVDFGSALAFVVRIGMIAERRDHHPDVALGWGKARVVWTTHDAGGITSLDFELADASDRAYSPPPA